MTSRITTYWTNHGLTLLAWISTALQVGLSLTLTLKAYLFWNYLDYLDWTLITLRVFSLLVSTALLVLCQRAESKKPSLSLMPMENPSNPSMDSQFDSLYQRYTGSNPPSGSVKSSSHPKTVLVFGKSEATTILPIPGSKSDSLEPPDKTV